MASYDEPDRSSGSASDHPDPDAPGSNRALMIGGMIAVLVVVLAVLVVIGAVL